MTFLQRFSDTTNVTLTDAATIAIDVSLGVNFQVTLGGNRTLGNPTNATATKEVWLAVKQDATGGRTLAFGSDWIATDATTTVNSAANAVSIIYAVARDFGAGTKWYYTVEHSAESSGSSLTIQDEGSTLSGAVTTVNFVGAGVTATGASTVTVNIPGGSSLTKHQLTGGTGEATTQLQVEVVVGGFHFDPTLYTGEVVTLRLVGDFTTSDGSASAQIRLYDMGASATFSPVRRSTVSIAFADVDKRIKVDQVLSMVVSPGTNVNEIHNVARNYELRMYLNTATTGSSMRTAWSGFLIS